MRVTWLWAPAARRRDRPHQGPCRKHGQAPAVRRAARSTAARPPTDPARPKGTTAMSEFSYFTDRLADQQIAERVATAQRSRVPGQHHPHGRRALAQRLHRMADRLDG